MIPEPLRSNYRTRANVRPIKCVLVIAARSARQFREAVLDSCTAWGGITNLIVPVGPSLQLGDLERFLLELHQPDVAISYLRVDSPTGKTRHDRLVNRLHEVLGSDVPVNAAQLGGSDIGCHALDAIPDDVLRQRQFSATRLVARSRREELALLACFGQIYPGQESDYVGMTRFGENPVAYDDLRFWSMQTAADPFASPINLTSYGYQAYEVTGSFGTEQFELVLGDDLESLCYFWNLRATRIAGRAFDESIRRVLLGPAALIGDKDSLGRLADAVRAAGSSSGVESEVELVVYGPKDGLRHFAEETKHSGRFRRHRGSFRMSRRFGGKDERITREGPVIWASSVPSLPQRFRYGVGFEGHEVLPFHAGANEVRVVPPARYPAKGGQVMLDFDSDVWARIPKSPASARAVHHDGRWTRHGLSMLARVARTPSFMALTIPDEFEALRCYFSDHDVELRLTRKSAHVDAIARLVGGPSRLSSFATRCAYYIVGALASKSPGKIAQSLRRDLGLRGAPEEIIAERLAEAGVVLDLSISKTAHELKTLESLRAHKDEVLPTLEILTEVGVLRRGIAVECSVCGVPNFHPIGSLGERVACNGCGEVRPLPVHLPEGSGRELPWSYSLNTLVNRAWDQDLGPSLVSLVNVAQGGQDVTCRGAALELLRGTRVLGDLDFVLYRDGRLLAGETKAGSGVGSKDIRISRTMLASGVDVFYFASIQGFSSEARERIDTVRAEFDEDEQERVVVLGPAQLFG